MKIPTTASPIASTPALIKSHLRKVAVAILVLNSLPPSFDTSCVCWDNLLFLTFLAGGTKSVESDLMAHDLISSCLSLG